MKNVTCQHCKFILQVETDTHPNYRCGHEAGILSEEVDPVTSRFTIWRQLCSVKNMDLDCEDFEQELTYTFWGFIKKRYLGIRP